jgi:hypothetical protein
MRLVRLVEDWLVRRRREREARRLVASLFAGGDLLRGTSLKPRHASRWVLVDFALDPDGGIATVRFGILRHPRPYAFSRQSHKVLEAYLYDVAAGRVTRERGLNLTREAESDAD